MPIYIDRGAAPEVRQGAVTDFLTHLFGQAVEISFSKTPSTDGKTVWLGELDPASDDFEILAVGHGIHEMQHVCESDLTAVRKKKSPFARFLFNVLEDVRIDTLGAKKTPSYRAYRDELAEHLEKKKELHASHDPESYGTPELFCVWLHTALMNAAHFDWAKRHMSDYALEVQKRLPLALLQETLRIAKKVIEAPDAGTAITAAEKIEKLWEQSACCPGESMPGEKAGSAPELQAVRAVLSLTEGEGIKVSLLAKMLPPKIKEAIGKLQAAAGDGAASGTGCGESKNEGEISYWHPEGKGRDIDHLKCSRYAELFAKSTESLHQLTQSFARLFAAPSFSQSQNESAFGAVFHDEFPSHVAMRSPKLFVGEKVNPAPQGSVAILVDRSGSMGESMLTSAKVAAAALYSAVHRIAGVDIHLAMFPGPERAPLCLISAEGEPPEETLRRLSTVTSFGGTPIISALEWAEDVLLRSPRKNKLIVLVTDGVFPEDKIESTEPALAEKGIELALLTIGEENTGLARNCCYIETAEDVAPALLHLMEATALRRALAGK